MEFVTFELAKKLKDLGFNEPFFFFYREDDKEKYVHHASISKPLIYCDKIDNEVIIAPTISQVLKWLREEKSLYIRINAYLIGWCFDIIDLNKNVRLIYTSDFEYQSYEQTAIAGIKYVLYNLI